MAVNYPKVGHTELFRVDHSRHVFHVGVSRGLVLHGTPLKNLARIEECDLGNEIRVGAMGDLISAVLPYISLPKNPGPNLENSNLT